jgi:hypothetical protein
MNPSTRAVEGRLDRLEEEKDEDGGAKRSASVECRAVALATGSSASSSSMITTTTNNNDIDDNNNTTASEMTAATSSDNSSSDSYIRPMDRDSVRRIVTGQAVMDLASCVKELLDNSIDAGSKNINSTLWVLLSFLTVWHVVQRCDH